MKSDKLKIKSSSYYSTTCALVYTAKTKWRTAFSVVHLESGRPERVRGSNPSDSAPMPVNCGKRRSEVIFEVSR